ncbi:MAG: site-specific integrase [Syntrophorhabdales bacterium]|jgi:integrase
MPTVKNSRERFLSYEQADMLLTEIRIRSQTTYEIALLSLHCGLRASEILNLKGKDIDLEHGIIHIRDPKNSQARTANMTYAVREIFEGRMPESHEEYVFKDKRHKEKIKQVSQAFVKAVDAVGLNQGVTDRLQKITFHTLRHTFASWLALQGESLLTIADLLGHKTLAMVKRYAHLMPDEKKQATLRLEKAFDESKKANGRQGEVWIKVKK